jgi:hypothetical protein
MKIFKSALHYWIAIVSVLSFLVGWGMLAHSLKPVAAASQVASPGTASLPALPPIQAFGGLSGSGASGSNGGSGLNFTAPINPPASSFPRLRSGGS